VRPASAKLPWSSSARVDAPIRAPRGAGPDRGSVGSCEMGGPRGEEPLTNPRPALARRAPASSVDLADWVNTANELRGVILQAEGHARVDSTLRRHQPRPLLTPVR